MQPIGHWWRVDGWEMFSLNICLALLAGRGLVLVGDFCSSLDVGFFGSCF